ncbi:uncharacterized protein LOC125496733 [Beta vulgaris subsp. vulgaris]|uniref:uncharacterized protein LOC125496733 n=1 Tax=Beta vulgaris subsp. vulgaris TaxID=3555 RepID=UPI002036BDBB|nr:uncharacterized protein LOC125496733 [Beta vulgaris subsp. vulgaris]
MHILSWNCRGLGSPEAVNALRRIVVNEDPQVVFLQETKLHQHELERVKMKLKYSGLLVVGCEGQGRKHRGGLALVWKREVQVSVTSYLQNHIDVMMTYKGQPPWRYTGIYGHPEESKKGQTGELLRTLFDDENVPWLCGGDLNLMLWSTEKQGGGAFNFEEANILRQAMDHCKLEDMGFIGHPFTWTNNRGGLENLQERLDRNERVGSVGKKRRKKLYRFEKIWLRDEKCMEIIQDVWRQEEDACRNIGWTATKLRSWSKQTFGNLAKVLRDLKGQMQTLMQENQIQEVIDR